MSFRTLLVLLLALSGSVAALAASLDTEEQAFATLINDYRQQHGLAPLKISDKLDAAATWMSTDMGQKNYFSHTDSLGRSFATRLNAFGYTYNTTKGENIAAGNATASSTFLQWKNSSGHNANMLNASYRVMGIARVYTAGSTYKWYWTNDFGGYDDSGAPTGDRTPPVVTITAPASGAKVSGTAPIRVSATDNVGVARVQFQVDNGALITDGAAPWEYYLPTTSLANGSHTATATAYDAAGNRTAATVSFTVYNYSAVGAPATPRNLRATPAATGALVSWTPGIGGGAPTSYEIQTATLAGVWQYASYTAPGSATSLTLAVPAAGTYWLHMRARNAAGYSPWSGWISAYIR